MIEKEAAPGVGAIDATAAVVPDSQLRLTSMIVRGCGLVTVAVGALYLAAWSSGAAARWSASGTITMKTNAALAITVAGSALLALGPGSRGGGRRRAGILAAAVVLLIGASTLGEHLLQRDLGIDGLLAAEPPGAAATSSPNRMGLPASSSLTLIGLGLLALASSRWRRVTPYLGGLVLFANLVPAVGYLFGIGAFYARARTGVAWPTVLALQLLAVGLTLAHRGGGPAAALLRRDAGGRFLRSLLPWTLFVPLPLGFLVLEGQRARLYDASTGIGGLVIALVLFFSLFLWRGAANLSRAVARQDQAHEALRASEARAAAALARLRVHVETTPLAVVEWDADYRLTHLSRRAEELLGWSAGEVLGRRIDEVPWVPEEDWPSVRAVMDGMATGALPTNVNVNHNVRKDGTVIHCEWYNSALRDEAGRLASVLSLVLEVMHRELAEEALRDSERKFATLFRRSPLAKAFSAGTEGAIVDVNDAWVALTGVPREEAVGRTAAALGLADAATWSRFHERLLAAQDGSAEGEVLLKTRGHGVRTASVWAQVLVLAGEQYLLSVMQDVTEQRRAEEALRESDHRKSEFLAVLSHELRNPLAPIRNGVYILDHVDPSSEQAVRARDIIRRQTEHLARMVDDLLDTMRITRGRFQLQRERLDLCDAVRKATEDLRPLFERCGVELRVERPAGATWVDADPTRIAQVLGNLLQNATKFCPRGGSVRVSTTAAGGWARLSVKDSGIGIDPALLERIFEPFAQADQGLARTSGGLGLGLHLVKSLAELHGGTAFAQSEGLGRGAELVVSLPLAERATA